MEVTTTKILKTILAKRNRIMKPELIEIIDENIVHTIFLDRPSVEKCVEESYNLGVKDVLNWLSKQDYLTDNIEYLIEEWNNQNPIIK